MMDVSILPMAAVAAAMITDNSTCTRDELRNIQSISSSAVSSVAAVVVVVIVVVIVVCARSC